MPSLVTDALLDAIEQVESAGNQAAVGDEGDSRGAFQVKEIAFNDVKRIFPEEFKDTTYDQVAQDYQTNRMVARRYLEALESHYGIGTLDRLIAAYNAGPGAKKGKIQNLDYVRKVKALLGDAMPQPSAVLPLDPRQQFAQRLRTLGIVDDTILDPTERAVMVMGRFAEAAGAKPLTVKDIEDYLAQAEAPRSLPGVRRARQDEILTPGVPTEEVPNSGASMLQPFIQSNRRGPVGRTFLGPPDPRFQRPGPPEFRPEFEAARRERRYGI